MNKQELAEIVAKETNFSKKDVLDILDRLLFRMIEGLVKGDVIRLVGFGMFEVKRRAAREGRNPRTKEVITIPETKTPVFVAGKGLKDAVKGRITLDELQSGGSTVGEES
jgi:DNA-binding protein HU-beta